jgi:hypothetical protein
MPTFKGLDSPQTRLKTVRAYIESLEGDRLKAADILQANERMLEKASFSADKAVGWHERLAALASRLQEEKANPPDSVAEMAVVTDLERCISENTATLPAGLSDRYSILLAHHQLAARRMQDLIRDLVKLNNELHSGIQGSL